MKPQDPNDSNSADPTTGQGDEATLRLAYAAALNKGNVASLDDFLAGLPESPTPEILMLLINDEIKRRAQLGQVVQITDFYADYPALKDLSFDTVQLESGSSDVHQTEASDLTTPVPNYLQTTLSVGDTIEDFELLAQLGRGAFATVYLARQTSMQRMVALKVSKDLGTEPQTLAQLDHPNIVRVFDQRPAAGHPFHLLYMQYVAGGTLWTVMKQVHRLPVENWSGDAFIAAVDEAVIARGESPSYNSTLRKSLTGANWQQTVCNVGVQLAEALDYAHRQKVLHRDIKPPNVLIGADCLAKLADFNVSFCADLTGSDARSQFGGSLAYMSPEQLAALSPSNPTSPIDLDHRSDLFSLGVVLYQLMHGQNPFPAATHSNSWTEQIDELIESRTKRDRPDGTNDPDENGSSVLSAAIQRCLNNDPSDRFSAASELAVNLRIGLEPEAEQLLYPPANHWSHLISRHFISFCFLIAGTVNILGVFFIRYFNLVQSLPPGEQAMDIFWNIQRVVNAVAFPVAIALFCYLLRHAWKVLRQIAAPDPKVRGQVRKGERIIGTRRLIPCGHLLAIICASEWILAGFIFPVALWMSGVPTDLSGAIDFVMSHTLAGLSITSVTFFGITYLVLRCWLPAMLRDAYTPPMIRITLRQLQRLSRLIPLYQVIAICVPSLAIALLVIVDNAKDKFALTVISLAGLIIIPLVFVASQQIQRMVQTIRRVFLNAA